MIRIQKNISLQPYNTFGINVYAARFATITSFNDLKEILAANKDIFILSGGSNILLTQNIEKLVIHINTKGVIIVKQTNNHIFIRVEAGENWHEFVGWCIKRNYGGVENLSLIPGNVGTAPIQNIGAYGVEVKNVIETVEALEVKTNKTIVFTNSECNFGYRNSIFKNKEKGKYIITHVTFKLTKNKHKLTSSYGAITAELEKNKITQPTIADISKAVIAIRKQKLPDPKRIGNSGSFFKNPVISTSDFKKFIQQHPKAPHYILSHKEVKIPAGWLVEQCGFKGKRFGDAGVHKDQALVLVNYGNATGKEMVALSKKIQLTVAEKFNIYLEVEVNII